MSGAWQLCFVSALVCSAALSAAADSSAVEGAAATAGQGKDTGAVGDAPLLPTSIAGWVTLPNKALRAGSGVRVLVNGQHATYVRQNGQFVVDLAPGVHVIDFAVRGFQMPQLRIDVSRKVQGKYKAMFNDRVRSTIPEPLEISPLAELHYFEPIEPFNPINLFKNPMVIMMAVMGALTLLMSQMPQDEMKEMLKNSGGDLSTMLEQAKQKEEAAQQLQQRKPTKARK